MLFLKSPLSNLADPGLASHDDNDETTFRYATGAALNSYSALIHDFYQKEVSSFPAVHLTMDTALTNERLGVKTYISAPVGITSKADNCMFIPIPCDVKYFKAERAGRKSRIKELPVCFANNHCYIAPEKHIAVRLGTDLTSYISEYC